MFARFLIFFDNSIDSTKLFNSAKIEIEFEINFNSEE